MTKPDIVEFVTASDLLGLSISPAQETLLRAIYGLPLDAEQLDVWRTCTGRDTYPQARFGETTVVAGARAGKDSRIAAPIACYEAVFGGHHERLAKGERGVIPIVAQDERATRIAFGYVRDYLMRSPILAQCVADERKRELVLTNGLSVCCFPCTVSALRGWSIPAGVMDEVAFFRLEGSSDSDAEVQTSIRRGGISFPETMLVKISTPYMKSGVLFEDFKRAFGQDNPDLLVWRAPSALMNPALTPERLARERRLDPGRYAREYEAEFQDDIAAFLPSVWVDEAVQTGRHELPPRDGATYVAACDPSGGGADHFTFSICHREDDRVVQDVIRGFHRIGGQAPNLAAAVAEISTTLSRYRLRELTGDRYAGQWVRQEFEKAGVRYVESSIDRSRAYLEVEPLFAQGRMELLDHERQVREFKLLERRARSGGNAAIDHPRGGHDDYANSCALAAAKLTERAVTVRVRRLE